MPKNYRKIPSMIMNRINSIKGGEFVASVRIKYRNEDINTKLEPLGISISGGKVAAPESFIPDPDFGKYCSINVNGEVIKRTDLPKITDYNTIESPNWGDESKGTHTVDLPFQRYPRDFIAPKYRKITIQHAPAGDSTVFQFQVAKIITKGGVKWDNTTKECLNILLETVGAANVDAPNKDIADEVAAVTLGWEIFPPEKREALLKCILGGRRQINENDSNVFMDRIDFITSLKPIRYVYGLGGTEAYFGGIIRDDLVVFENSKYGNAIYVMYHDWERLSNMSRTQLLSGRLGVDFDRVIHVSGWKSTVRKLVNKRLIKSM
jgi:hypothetical protein